MTILEATDHLNSISTQLVGLSEFFRILSEYDQPVRLELFEFLSGAADRMGEECKRIRQDLHGKEIVE